MDIVRDYLHLIKNEFHAGDERAFFQQRWLLIKAITYLAKRGVFLPQPDYRKILDTVISGIKDHGNRDTIRYFGRYLLSAFDPAAAGLVEVWGLSRLCRALPIWLRIHHGAHAPGSRTRSHPLKGHLIPLPRDWWRYGDSNPRPSHCERDALPAELYPQLD